MWTASDVRDLAAQAAQGLLADGVAVGERVLLMMRNRPDFHWLDLAAQFIRATPVSIYNSSSPEEIQYLAERLPGRGSRSSRTPATSTACSRCATSCRSSNGSTSSNTLDGELPAGRAAAPNR